MSRCSRTGPPFTLACVVHLRTALTWPAEGSEEAVQERGCLGKTTALSNAPCCHGMSLGIRQTQRHQARHIWSITCQQVQATRCAPPGKPFSPCCPLVLGTCRLRSGHSRSRARQRPEPHPSPSAPCNPLKESPGWLAASVAQHPGCSGHPVTARNNQQEGTPHCHLAAQAFFSFPSLAIP